MKRTGFRLTDAIAAMAVLFVAVPMLFAAMGQQRLAKLQMQNTTQVRGIVQCLVTYGGSNHEYYPGSDAKGNVIDVSPTGVYQALLDNNSFSSKYLISPIEDLKPWRPDDELTHDNFSFAILDVDPAQGNENRLREWRQTINTQAVVVSDRNTGAEEGYASIWTPHVEQDGWVGSLGRNDGSAQYVSSPVIDETLYGRSGKNEDDHLFESDSDGDALMTFFKDEDGREQPVAARAVPAEDAQCGTE